MVILVIIAMLVLLYIFIGISCCRIYLISNRFKEKEALKNEADSTGLTILLSWVFAWPYLIWKIR